MGGHRAWLLVLDTRGAGVWCSVLAIWIEAEKAMMKYLLAGQSILRVRLKGRLKR